MEQHELIRAARDGDGQALLRLLAACQPNLRRYARQSCATEDIEEAVQDAMLILHRRLGTLRVIATFSGWLFQIVRRACRRRLRQRGPVSLDNDAALHLHDPADIELRMDLSRAIGALPPLYRDVVVLRDVQGLSAEEAAAEIGASVQATKSRLHRGRHLVRQLLSERTP